MLTKKDLAQLEEKGQTLEEFNHYMELLKSGAEPAELVRPALPGDGIRRLSDKETEELESLWRQEGGNWSVEKFVPASGAATRMFREFHAYLKEGTESSGVTLFFENLEDFAFFKDLGTEHRPRRDEEKWALLNFLLSEDGWNWSALPKGLLPFHRIGDRTVTPFEEHLREGAMATEGKSVKIHFTVSPAHLDGFKEIASRIVPLLEEEFSVAYEISYSFQDPSTDTPALDERGEPFRKEDGSLLFRPGGHGALIKNLNRRDGDILFLKNIDNVGTGEYREVSAKWFRIFGALLLKARTELDHAEEALRLSPDEENHLAACEALKRWGGIDLCGGEDTRQLLRKLNRPVRICGVVKNDGDTGGGPFWIIDGRGDCSLQIVESAQIDTADTLTKKKRDGATHFNPVFIACSPRNCSGQKVDLEDFVDKKAVFTTEKSLEGKKLTALEHPGLWNGAMAYWNTTFVEIPLKCFNPVKSLPDLLKKAHI